MRSISRFTRSIVGLLSAPRRISTMPSTMSSSPSLPAMPRRGWCPAATSATSRSRTAAPALRPTRVASSAAGDSTSPTPRTTTFCAPISMAWPPTLALLEFSAWTTCASVTFSETRRRGSTVTSQVLVLPPQPVTSMTPGTALKRRSSTQSCSVLRSTGVAPGGPTTRYR